MALSVLIAVLLHGALVILITLIRDEDPPAPPFDAITVSLWAGVETEGSLLARPPPSSASEETAETSSQAAPEAAAPVESELAAEAPPEESAPSEVDGPAPPAATPVDVAALARAMIGARADAIDPSPPAVAGPPGPAAAEGACEASGVVQTVLQKDEKLLAAVAAMPRESVSVAGALQLWNGAWVAASDDADRAVGMLRDAVVHIAASLPAECRKVDLLGPRFMLLTTASTTIVLAVGSGRWQWSELDAEVLDTSDGKFKS